MSLQASLVTQPGPLPAGHFPQLTFRLVNAGDQPVRFLTYLIDYRLKAALVATNLGKGPSFELQPFRPLQLEKPSNDDVLTLEPGEDWTHPFLWSDAWQFGFIQRHSQPPMVTPGYKLKGFPAGQFRFSTLLFDQLGAYVGQDGLFDHQLKSYRLPDDIPEGRQCWGDMVCPEVEAEAVVEFA